MAGDWSEGGMKGLVCAQKFNGTERKKDIKAAHCVSHIAVWRLTHTNELTELQKHDNATTDITCKDFYFRKQNRPH